MNIFKKKTEKHTEKLPMTGKVKKGFRIYCTAIMGCSTRPRYFGYGVCRQRPHYRYQ